MKRSLLLTHDFPPVLGGISTFFFNLWSRLPACRMLIVTPDHPGARAFDDASPLQPVRFRTCFGGIAGKVVSMIKMFFITFYYCAFGNVRELHAGQVLSTGPIVFFFQAVLRIPSFLWLYGAETGSAYHRSPLKRAVALYLIRHFDRVVTNSPTTTREFIDFGIPAGKIIELPPGVDAELFSPGRADHLRNRLGLEGREVIITVARLVKRKGHDCVLRAMKYLEHRQNLTYVIIGHGNDRPRLERLVEEYGIGERVMFTGVVPDGDLPAYYRMCDVYVMPNREVFDESTSIEGFGISFIEAGACEKPVIAGNSGGAVDAVVDGVTGYVIDPEDARECAGKIEYLLDHPAERASMGHAARERILREFTWQQRAAEFSAYLTIGDMTIVSADDSSAQ